MSDDLEMRLEDVENRLAALEGAEPFTREIGQPPVSLAQVNREVQFIWRDVRAIRSDIAEIKTKLGI